MGLPMQALRQISQRPTRSVWHLDNTPLVHVKGNELRQRIKDQRLARKPQATAHRLAFHEAVKPGERNKDANNETGLKPTHFRHQVALSGGLKVPPYVATACLSKPASRSPPTVQ